LLAQFGAVAATDLPVIGIVSRFAAQKGFDLIADIANRLTHEDLILVVLGTGDKPYEEMFRRLNRQFPRKFLVKIAYDEALAHKIEAGADMFLMPSRYEPCGLNQIYSLRYGTVPVARATGGLDDTIEAWDPVTGKGTGFKFSEPSGEALLETVRTAIGVFKYRDAWQKLMRNGMGRDFSWAVSAREYIKTYEKVHSFRGGALATGASPQKDFLLEP
jgi:starch synthase